MRNLHQFGFFFPFSKFYSVVMTDIADISLYSIYRWTFPRQKKPTARIKLARNTPSTRSHSTRREKIGCQLKESAVMTGSSQVMVDRRNLFSTRRYLDVPQESVSEALAIILRIYFCQFTKHIMHKFLQQCLSVQSTCSCSWKKCWFAGKNNQEDSVEAAMPELQTLLSAPDKGILVIIHWKFRISSSLFSSFFAEVQAFWDWRRQKREGNLTLLVLSFGHLMQFSTSLIMVDLICYWRSWSLLSDNLFVLAWHH